MSVFGEYPIGDVAASPTVNLWEHGERSFEVVMASDVVREGMGLELTELGSVEGGPVLEAFWQDDGSGFDFIAHRPAAVPFAVVERFVSAARKRLPPSRRGRRTDPKRTDIGKIVRLAAIADVPQRALYRFCSE